MVDKLKKLDETNLWSAIMSPTKSFKPFEGTYRQQKLEIWVPHELMKYSLFD